MRRAEEVRNEIICMSADKDEEINRRNDMQVEWLKLAILDQGSKMVFASSDVNKVSPQLKA